MRSISDNSTRRSKDTSSGQAGVAGWKKTSQRAAILDAVHRGHLDANEIYKLARAKVPRLSLATVYRTLRKLKELGLLEELHFDEAHHHYEMKPSSEHQHLVCLGCGQVMEFEYRLSPEMKDEIDRDKGFMVTGAEIQIVGYCQRCRDSARKQRQSGGLFIGRGE